MIICLNCLENHRGENPMYETPEAWECTKCYYMVNKKKAVVVGEYV